ncbi:uncharacterized protein LOC128881389 isoform X2 [Hylaeus volcanicus]|nr:uncharacterized protein LOC128881389 isoform X2 [Hylaeus volcanicus]XP_053988372.1 uncharacterized protein LOC128881389 isoform X2 [Hylaeus volcanicus]XP_053988373.1 uncharacterized protein LOC128881389 isoform X2 [Hylaeus volcanicus]
MNSLIQAQQGCPLCKKEFSHVRNFVAEDLIQNLKLLQLAVKKDILIIQEKYNKEIKDIFTQTNETKNVNTSTTSTQTTGSLRMKTSSTQTQTKVKKNPPNKTISDITNILQKSQNNKISYPCLIGSCLFQNSMIKELEHHMNVCHAKQLFMENEDIFSKTFIMDGNVLPCNYDYVFLINEVGLLFFNSIYHSNGRLRIGVQFLQTVQIPKIYKYVIQISNDTLTFIRHGKVTPITHKTRAVVYTTIIHEKDMACLLGVKKHLKCTLLVTKCS